MRAFELIGKVDEQRQLQVQVPETLPPGPVRIIVLIPEEDEVGVEETFDVTQDPIFQMEGYESDAPTDLSANLDQYLYGEKYPR
jgi:hypothetical protein